ncbi:LCP family protein required for cell wall assembly [Marmoricola sp. OAE513]|uniref:LCP family protein n=1 Tax=Marmoricola sp. OAE513 TaxID=2817894 RepID=UPI001AE3DC85
MSWDSEHVPQHRGRHKATRPDQVGRALKRALLATLGPAVVLGIGAFVLVKVASRKTIDLFLDPDQLMMLVLAIGIVWLMWVVFILRTYARNRADVVSSAARLGGAFLVVVMCGAVTAPMAYAGYVAAVQRDLILKVFPDDGGSATTPDVTKENPWGNRKRVNVLLLGGDGSIHRPGVRTDSVMLASINTKTGKTVLFSLPRNLQNVPFQPGSKLAELYPNGFTDGTPNNAEFFLNAVYRNVPAVHPGVLGKTANEGADAIKLAVAGALGIPVDYYVLVNLSGFSKLVDAMGGITVNINERVPIGGNTDAHILPDDYLEPGPNQRLNGFNALWYTRGRYGSTDYKRMERQRCAINAIAAEASPTKMLTRYTKLAKASKQIVRTDIPQELLSAFVDLATLVKGKPMKSVGFERSADFDPNAPDFEFVHAAVKAALRPAKKAAGTPTGTPTNGTANTSKSPSKGSNTKDDCAYNPSTNTAG